MIDALAKLHHPLHEYLTHGPLGGLLHVLIAAAVLVAGMYVARALYAVLRRMGRHGAYGYHRSLLDQAREAGDTEAMAHHQLRVRLLADQLDKSEGDA